MDVGWLGSDSSWFHPSSVSGIEMVLFLAPWPACSPDKAIRAFSLSYISLLSTQYTSPCPLAMKLQRMRNLAAAIFALTACLLPLLVHADEHNHVVRLYTILVSFSSLLLLLKLLFMHWLSTSRVKKSWPGWTLWDHSTIDKKHTHTINFLFAQAPAVLNTTMKLWVKPCKAWILSTLVFLSAI